MSSIPGTPSQPKQMVDVQSALFELHDGLMSLKASLLELARHHEEEAARHIAQQETDALLARLRGRA